MGSHVPEVSAADLERFRAKVAPGGQEDDVPCDPRHMPGDPKALRGIPMVGGASGAIPGTRPGDSAAVLDRDDRYLRRPRVKRPAA